jgi:hypothetical protein
MLKSIYFITLLLYTAAINACDTVVCATDATCISTPGSFECRCNEGFEGDGTTECTPAAELGKLHESQFYSLDDIMNLTCTHM